MKKLSLCLILPLLLLGACQSPADRAQEQVSQGVYAVNDSMTVGRFDLAKNYSDDLVKTVPPPKHRIKVQAFTVKGSN